jgi:hypothetical protein
MARVIATLQFRLQGRITLLLYPLKAFLLQARTTKSGENSRRQFEFKSKVVDRRVESGLWTTILIMFQTSHAENELGNERCVFFPVHS